MCVFLLRFGLVYFLPFCLTQSTTCTSGQQYNLRLYNTKTGVAEDGSVQICYSGTWYAVCDYYWSCGGANVACRQLGYDKARQYIYDSDNTFGSWSNIWNSYSCSGNENSLTSCGAYYHYYYCHTYNDEAGVRCIKTSSSSCSNSGSLRLTGGTNDNEGVLEYCFNGKWSPFCYLDDEEAAVACKQLGYSQYAGFLSPDEYIWDFPTNYTGSMFNSFSCSSYATESSLSQCTQPSSISYTECGVACQHPKAIKCHRTNECTDGEIRLMNGSIPQEGRVEVCVDGVWGSVCGSGWTKQAAFVICKQAGYIYSEPVIYSNSEYGVGKTPIVYYNIQCQGWEKSISECTKTHYLHFSCSVTAGLLCPDDCANGDARLVGGETSNEGTIEICHNNLWGLITDASWDEKDAEVMCRQLNLPFDGAQPMYDSHFGKPDRAIHYSYVLCDGGESSITSCKKIEHSLSEGRQIFEEALVAGVVCKNATPTVEPVCIPIPQQDEIECTDGDLNITKSGSGLMKYCVDGKWSVICHLTHNETTVACRQLGYTTFTWGLPYDIDDISSSTDYSLISNISCVSTENKLSDCTVNKVNQCMKYCQTALGLNCYKPGECSEGSIRLTDGDVEQEGRVEVCVNGVWGSVCDNGWDTTDAYVVCQQLGYSDLKPLPFWGDHFGPSSGPVVYSDVHCEGWEKNFEECRKKSHLELLCSQRTVAGVMCSDDCSNGDVRLVGSEGIYNGTVEICYDNLWGLIDEDGWGISDANVVCHQLGFERAETFTTGSMFGKPNKVIHVSGVQCSGDEIRINECPAKHHSLEEGKKLIPSVEVAGVICYTPTTTSIATPTTTSIATPTTTSIATPTHSQTATEEVESITSTTMTQERVKSSLYTRSPSHALSTTKLTRGSVAPLTSINNDSSQIMVVLVVLVTLLLIMMMIMSIACVGYCIRKSLRERKIRHKHLPAMTMTRIKEDNEYNEYYHSSDEDSDGDMKQLIKTESEDKEKSLAKDKEIDNTFKPIDDDEPIYEVCSPSTKY